MTMNDNKNAEPDIEEEAKKYKPSPIELENVKLPPYLVDLTEIMAENTHNCWAKARIEQGWSYGPHRDDLLLKHPDLLPYRLLSEEEKEYDRVTAMNALKLIITLGYTICRK